MRKNYFAGPNGNGAWQVKGEGNQRATKVFDTQEEAWNEAKSRARDNEGKHFFKAAMGK